MKNIDAKTKCTIDEALAFLLMGFDSIALGTNVRIIGNRDRYLRFSLKASVEASTRDSLDIELYVDDVRSVQYNIFISDERYAPPKEMKNNESIGGGWWWAHDHKFYNYVPELTPLTREIQRIIDFHLNDEVGSKTPLSKVLMLDPR